MHVTMFKPPDSAIASQLPLHTAFPHFQQYFTFLSSEAFRDSAERIDPLKFITSFWRHFSFLQSNNMFSSLLSTNVPFIFTLSLSIYIHSFIISKHSDGKVDKHEINLLYLAKIQQTICPLTNATYSPSEVFLPKVTSCNSN